MKSASRSLIGSAASRPLRAIGALLLALALGACATPPPGGHRGGFSPASVPQEEALFELVADFWIGCVQESPGFLGAQGALSRLGYRLLGDNSDGLFFQHSDSSLALLGSVGFDGPYRSRQICAVGRPGVTPRELTQVVDTIVRQRIPQVAFAQIDGRPTWAVGQNRLEDYAIWVDTLNVRGRRFAVVAIAEIPR